VVGVLAAALIVAVSAATAATASPSADHSRSQVFLVTVGALSGMAAMATIVLSVEVVRHRRTQNGHPDCSRAPQHRLTQ
jgi:hypothetical protein